MEVRAEEMTSPAGVLRGTMSNTDSARAVSTPPTRVGIPMQSATDMARSHIPSVPGGESTTPTAPGSTPPDPRVEGPPRRPSTGGRFPQSGNPIYLAVRRPLASLAFGSLSAAMAAVGIYILAMNTTVIRKEERDLLHAFGAEFSEYLTKVPRWLF